METLMTYEFTLILNGVTDQTAGLEDHLFAAGCDDALIHFRNGTAYLDFMRQSPGLEDAVISAILAVEACPLNARVISVLPENLVSEADIAKRLNKGRQIVSLWVKRKRRQKYPFPSPVTKVSDKSPMWSWYDVTKWLLQNDLIADKSTVDTALFMESLNMVLSERDPVINQCRQHILKRLS